MQEHASYKGFSEQFSRVFCRRLLEELLEVLLEGVLQGTLDSWKAAGRGFQKGPFRRCPEGRSFQKHAVLENAAPFAYALI